MRVESDIYPTTTIYNSEQSEQQLSMDIWLATTTVQ